MASAHDGAHGVSGPGDTEGDDDHQKKVLAKKDNPTCRPGSWVRGDGAHCEGGDAARRRNGKSSN